MSFFELLMIKNKTNSLLVGNFTVEYFFAGFLLLLLMAVRVRFAPSPTGQLHLGGFRTALFNFLFARQNPGGKFLIRIEDTDRTRLVPGAEQKLIDVLNWAGITADENPVRQSDRLHFYKSASNQLLSSDRAYR